MSSKSISSVLDVELIGLGVVSVLASLVLTGLLREYAISNKVLDIPNKRSSHFHATPRGGGLAIVLVFMCSLPALNYLGILTSINMIGLLGSGLLVSAVGFADDRKEVPVFWRLVAHFLAAAWGIVWLDLIPSVEFPGVGMELAVGLGAVVYVVWFINLFNFMDGIDGLASLETVTVCIGLVVLAILTSSEQYVLGPPFALACATLGFLVWNFPRAKIFMGDAGSGFLGLMLSLISLQAALFDPLLLVAFIILFGAFIVDTGVTLARRVINGEKFYEAHCSHAYQYAARKYKSHKVVSSFFALLNVGYLLPLAVMVVLREMSIIMALVVAFAPLLMLAILFKAGDGASQ